MAETKTAPQTPTVPTAEITLGGRARALRFDFNALAAAEEKTGRNYCNVLTLLHPDATDRRALVWGALLHAEPKLEIATVGEWLHPAVRSAVDEALGRLVEAFLPPAEEAVEAEAEDDAAPLAEGAAA
jgi:hypothetical protein